MTNRLDRVATETLGALHRDTIADSGVVRAILERAIEVKSVLHAGIDQRNDPRVTTIICLDGNSMLLSAVSMGKTGRGSYSLISNSTTCNTSLRASPLLKKREKHCV